MVSHNLWISYSAFTDTNFCLLQISFFTQAEKAGIWKIFVFGNFTSDFNDYVFLSLDFIGICSYMVTSIIIAEMMQISENWQGKSSALHFNDFGFHKTFFAVLYLSINGVLLRQTFLFFERKKSQREKVAEKLRRLHQIYP